MKQLTFAVLAVLGTGLMYAQTTDTSGDSLLRGAYRFRHVAVINVNSNYDPSEVAASFGVITFDGAGNYSITGTYVDNVSASASLFGFGTSGTQQALNVTGTYSLGTNGSGYVSNPWFPTDGNEVLAGAVAQGVFVGSDTESYYNSYSSYGVGYENDVFIAIPVGTPPVNSGFTAPYWVGLLDFTAGISTAEKNAMFKLVPNGQGGFGALSVNGFANNQGSTNLSQTVSGASYNFAVDGNATLNIPLPAGVSSANALFTGSKSMFVSTDGSFVLGWTQSGYDIFFGVRSRSAPASSSFAGTYFFAGLEDFPGQGADDYSGSIAANGLGNQTLDQRLNFYALPAEDYVCSGNVNFNLDGTGGVLISPCPDFQYAFLDSGKAVIGIGNPGDYTLMVGLLASPQPCSGVCILSSAIYNAASYVPVTTPVAPGELVTIYVTGLPAVQQECIGGQACPYNLGGVQVTMNNVPAPIFSVSGANGTVSALVPFELSPSVGVASIQVNSAGTLSNIVNVYLGYALPGAFTYSQNGVGQAIAEHADGTFVTSQSPAAPGETIVMILSGLGSVSPAIADGAVPPSTPPFACALLFTTNTSCASNNSFFNFNDYVNGVSAPATGVFAAAFPGFAAVYQLNITVPAGVGPGNVYLEMYTSLDVLGGFSFDVNQVQIPVGSAPAAAAESASKTKAAPMPLNGRRTRPKTPASVPAAGVRTLHVSAPANQ